MIVVKYGHLQICEWQSYITFPDLKFADVSRCNGLIDSPVCPPLYHDTTWIESISLCRGEPASFNPKDVI